MKWFNIILNKTQTQKFIWLSVGFFVCLGVFFRGGGGVVGGIWNQISAKHLLGPHKTAKAIRYPVFWSWGRRLNSLFGSWFKKSLELSTSECCRRRRKCSANLFSYPSSTEEIKAGMFSDLNALQHRITDAELVKIPPERDRRSAPQVWVYI